MLLHRFTATIGDRKVVTEVKRKEQAQEEFDAALAQGHTAVQLRQASGANLFSVEIGNLRAMEEAVIEFSYVRLLSSVAGAVEFEHMATWVPPYCGSGNGTTNPDGLAFSEKVSYSLSYEIKVHSSRGFRSIESPSAVTVMEDSPSVRTVTLAESGKNSNELQCQFPKPYMSTE